jgi:Fe-S cluster assembly protein SufD
MKEPEWLTAWREQGLARYRELPWPHPSDEIWRRTDVSLLDLARGFAPAEATLQERLAVSDAQLGELTRPLGGEHLLVRAGGAWLAEDPPAGLLIEPLAAAVSEHPARRAIEADGLSPTEEKLTGANLAFHQEGLCLAVPGGWSAQRPVRLVHVLPVGAAQAAFPLTVIVAGAGSRLTLIDEYVSVDPQRSGGAHLVNGRIELVLDPGASVHYVRLQRLAPQAREFLFQRATLAQGASLTLANLNLGASLSKAHIVTRLTEPEASSRIYGFVFGRGSQHIDQHTLQDHRAPRTLSDLHYKAALQGTSRMIYTGLIRIAKPAIRTEAFQANHNLLLDQGTEAETIPMLEILADDVRCKHGASVGPIDEEQTFYLMTRGLPRDVAERLIVMGFVEPMIQQVPFEPLQEQLRQEIEGGLRAGGQGAGGGGQGDQEP